MTKNTSSGTGEHFGEFVETQAKERRHSSASDVVRVPRRRLEAQEVKLAALRALIAG